MVETASNLGTYLRVSLGKSSDQKSVGFSSARFFLMAFLKLPGP